MVPLTEDICTGVEKNNELLTFCVLRCKAAFTSVVAAALVFPFLFILVAFILFIALKAATPCRQTVQ